MKRLIWLLALLSGHAAAADTGCTHTGREHYVSGWEDAPSVEYIHQRVVPESTVRCAYFPDRENRLNVLVRYEEGALNGVGYKIYYPDGSGIVQGSDTREFSADDRRDAWHLSCRQSGSGTGHVCALHKRDLRLQKDSRGHWRLSVGEHHRKDSEWLVRVDGNWAVTAPAGDGFSDEQTRELIAQMKRGTNADTRYFDPSLRGPTGRSMDLYGFGEALEIMDAVLGQLRKRPDKNA